MKEPKTVKIHYDESMVQIIESLSELQKKYNLRRVNSYMLLIVLLEEENSMLYECLCATAPNNPKIYDNLIKDCNQNLKIKEGEIQEEIQTSEKTFKMADVDGKHIELYFDKEVQKLFDQMHQDVLEYQLEQNDMLTFIDITSEDLFISFIDYPPKSLQKILKSNGVFFEGIREFYEALKNYDAMRQNLVLADENYTSPHLEEFIQDISAKYEKAERCEFLGREKEVKQIMRTLQKRGKKNVILVGEPGVGKSAIAEMIAFQIAKGECPEALKGHKVLQLNVTDAIAGTKYRGMAEERIKDLIEFLEKQDKVILFIDEIHMIIGAGATSANDSLDMANSLKPFLASGKSKVIGATTEAEYEKYIAKSGAFARRFEKVVVKEPKSTIIYSMLKNAIKAHEEYHGVKISKDMVEYVVLISGCFRNTTHNPDRTNDLIDSSMVIAKEDGKKRVDKKSILKNFDIDFEKFEKMDDFSKRSTAYHEAGHYLVWLKSEKLSNSKAVAISIMPTKEYMGVTVFDDVSDEVTIYTDKDYFIDEIASDLAGRVAEEKFTHRISSGARVDLDRANKYAYKIVTEFGMSTENRIYFEDQDYHMMSEKIRDKIDEEVAKLIKEATERAEQIISDNEILLEKIVDALMKKSILDENELEAICKGL